MTGGDWSRTVISTARAIPTRGGVTYRWHTRRPVGGGFSSVSPPAGPLSRLDSPVTQRESRLSAQIMREFRARGAWCLKIHGGPATLVGAPDIIGCWHGRFFAIETKLDTAVTPRQAYVHGKIRDAGGVIVVAHSVREAIEATANALRLPLVARVTRTHPTTPATRR